LAIILSVCLCIIVSTVVYLFVFLLLGHFIVCLSVYYCVDRFLSFCLLFLGHYKYTDKQTI
jgi:hypothetical protein